jgi:hypothetical protein
VRTPAKAARLHPETALWADEALSISSLKIPSHSVRPARQALGADDNCVLVGRDGRVEALEVPGVEPLAEELEGPAKRSLKAA